MSIGRTIRLFLADGSPNGVITAEIMNWTGHVLSAPRASLVEVLRRPEANRTGVYFLVGSDPEHLGQSIVYIGESDNVGERLTQHNRDENKGFWETTCIVTNKDANLTKAHVRYLESRLIGLSNRAARARLTNGTAPDFGFLPESDISDMEYFIEQLQTLLPVLGFDFFD
ncbi:MAG: GIY-YIG nuclease family protein [Rhizomicrobium sp.]